jgi:hypothetical protein
MNVTSRADRLERCKVVLAKVHLVHAHEEVRNPEERRNVRMSTRLRKHPETGVDQNDGDVRGRSARRHVPRVLNVAGRVGDDELALLRREVAVRDVNRDALLALCSEAVRDEGQVDDVALLIRSAFDRAQLIFVEPVRVVEQASDERGLAVIDRTDRREPQQLLVLMLLEVTEDVLLDQGLLVHQK